MFSVKGGCGCIKYLVHGVYSVLYYRLPSKLLNAIARRRRTALPQQKRNLQKCKMSSEACRPNVQRLNRWPPKFLMNCSLLQ